MDAIHFLSAKITLKFMACFVSGSEDRLFRCFLPHPLDELQQFQMLLNGFSVHSHFFCRGLRKSVFALAVLDHFVIGKT